MPWLFYAGASAVLVALLAFWIATTIARSLAESAQVQAERQAVVISRPEIVATQPAGPGR